jgi:hypothetical protein
LLFYSYRKEQKYTRRGFDAHFKELLTNSEWVCVCVWV